MAYDPDTMNSMQLSLGLTPGGWTPPQPSFMPPAMAAQQMQAQATQQLAAGSSMTRLPSPAPSGPVAAFGQQFQQQFQAAQAMQSYNPYIAQSLSGGGYPQGMMPSPLMMTPPSTGIFRPPPQMQMAAVPPQQISPLMPGGFTPQLPQPMFQTAWDREIQQREYRADRLYSMGVQAPRMLGTAAGIGAGALAGAQVGGAFGPMGRMVGAAGGALAAGVSGFAGGVGDAAMLPMQPSLEIHGMGASLQRMSQQWVVQGPQMHQFGAGLGRGPAQDLAGQIRNMAGERGFRAETGGMFNREDLMRMTEQSGRSGLMDMEQGTEGIRNNLRQVARTVRRFMQLTGDPDVTSVIREMGQLRAYGMSVQEMEQAARNMKTFARAAGTTIQGVQAMGGLPGAMMYQGVGLSAASGFEAGTFALASARQAVAAGTFSPRELAQFGGVQGVAQRNMQANAAMMTMPLFGAAIGGYGQQGWGVNYGNLAQAAGGGGQGLGAAGMVLGAVQNMGQAVAQGGVAALAEFPLRQRLMQEEAARAMSPAQQTAMRFQMAQQTGKMLGFQGTGAFTVGARALYGDEVAEQMMMEARNPRAFREQARMMRRQNQEIARSQREDIINAAPGFIDVLGEKLGISASDRGIMDRIGAGIGNINLALTRDNPVMQYLQDKAARERGERIVRVSPLIAIENERQRQNVMKGIGRGDMDSALMQSIRAGASKGQDIGWVQSRDLMALGMSELYGTMERGREAATGIMTVGGGALSLVGGPVGAIGIGAGVAGQLMNTDFVQQAIAGQVVGGMSTANQAKLVKYSQMQAGRRMDTIRASRRVTEDSQVALAGSLAKYMVDPGKELGAGYATNRIQGAANILAQIARSKVPSVGSGAALTESDIKKAIDIGIARPGMSESEKQELYNNVELRGALLNLGKAAGGAGAAGKFLEFEEQAGAGMSGLSGQALQDALAKRAKGYEQAISGWGGESDVGQREVLGLMREGSAWEHLALVSAAGGLSQVKMDEAMREYVKQGGKAEDWGRLVSRGRRRVESGQISSKGRGALEEQGKALSVQQIVGQVQTIRQESEVGVELSGMRAVGKAAGIAGLEAYAGMGGEEMLGAFTAENLQKLGQAGGGRFKGIAEKIARAKGATGAQRRQLIGEARQAMAGEGTLTAGITTEGLTEATGDAAAKNEAAAKALEDVAKSLEDAGFDKFKKGSDIFYDGAKKLQAAMESATIQLAAAPAKAP